MLLYQNANPGYQASASPTVSHQYQIMDGLNGFPLARWCNVWTLHVYADVCSHLCRLVCV